MSSSTLKRCPRCTKRKKLSEFHKELKRPGGTQSWCKECEREARRLAAQELRKRLRDYREEHPCENCLQFYPHYVMEFHHKNGRQKGDYSVSELSGHSWKRILEEISKCALLCSNCHLKRHHTEQ
jgi:hypothetical protein